MCVWPTKAPRQIRVRATRRRFAPPLLQHSSRHKCKTKTRHLQDLIKQHVFDPRGPAAKAIAKHLQQHICGCLQHFWPTNCFLLLFTTYLASGLHFCYDLQHVWHHDGTFSVMYANFASVGLHFCSDVKHLAFVSNTFVPNSNKYTNKNKASVTTPHMFGLQSTFPVIQSTLQPILSFSQLLPPCLASGEWGVGLGRARTARVGPGRIGHDNDFARPHPQARALSSLEPQMSALAVL